MNCDNWASKLDSSKLAVQVAVKGEVPVLQIPYTSADPPTVADKVVPYYTVKQVMELALFDKVYP